MKSPIKNKISNVLVHVSDLKRSAQWYSDLLGFPVIHERLNGGPVYWMELEGNIGIILDDNSLNKKRVDWDERNAPLYMFSTNSVEAAYQFLKEKQVDITLEPETPHPGLTFFNLKDLDGNVLMVCRSNYEKSEIPQRQHDIPIKNRIGAVFAHVTNMKKSIKWYSDILGLPYNSNKDWESIYEIPMDEGLGLLLDNNHVNDDENKALFMFDTDDIDASYLFAKQKGITISSEIERPGPVSFFTIKDPDNNILMVCQNHE
jgi:catechol 2,3-dioxygenase-like lactoylglutathione lyase family enzyme